MNEEIRIERDSMGEMEVPASTLYGASTRRAALNFPISGVPVDVRIIHAYGLMKRAAAEVNGELGELPAEIADLLTRAAQEVAEGRHDAHFPVDIYQTGSGTSTNMNVNEVLANRCAQLANVPLDAPQPDKPVHPNDHANHGQSSNDTFPTALHLSASLALRDELLPALGGLHQALAAKAEEFHGILKIGRTHLMDATPVRLGQEFSGFAQQLERAVDRTHKALKALHELPLGGTAVGTGLNAHPEFAERTIALLAEETGIEFTESANHFEAQGSRDALVEAHGQLNTIATSLHKIANDIRLLASGPRCSLGEIALPPAQPGSSIMPGKVNPVFCEALTMVAARVFGNHATVTCCGANGQLELNTYMPVLGQTVLESIRLLATATTTFGERCVAGIEANRERCNELIEQSLSMVTSLAPLIGYDRAAAIAKESLASGRSVRELCEEQLDQLGLSRRQLDETLDPARMAGS